MTCSWRIRSRLFIALVSLIFASLVFPILSPQLTNLTSPHKRLDSNGRVIWALWDKQPIPVVIRLCLVTAICHNQADNISVQLVNQAQLLQLIDNVHPAFEHLIPAHKADYFRARILDTYGGMYIDADTIALGSVKHLFDKLNTYDLVNIDWAPDGDPMAVGIMGPSKAQSLFTQRWVSGVHKLLDKKLEDLRTHSVNDTFSYPIAWSEMLRQIAVPTIKKVLKESTLNKDVQRFQYLHFKGHTTFGQLTNTGNGVPFDDFSNQTFSFTETELLMLHQSGVGESIRAMSARDLLRGHYLFSSLVRYSMNECREGRSQLMRNKTIAVDDSTGRNDDLIQWIESFMIDNDL